MVYDGRAVANFVLDRCDASRRQVTHLALQKIVFFCHVWSLVRLGRPLVKHSFEAWEHGPVLPYLYREFKQFDRLPVKSRAKRIDPLDGTQRIVDYTFDAETSELLRDVVDFYSRMRPGDLRELSHIEGGPWEKVWNHEGTVNPGMKIENGSIAEFYSRAPPPFRSQ